MPLTKLLTPAGKRSLSYFLIQRRQPNPRLCQVTPIEFNRLRNFITYPGLTPVILDLLRNPVVAVGSLKSEELYPLFKTRSIVKISTLTSKALRINNSESEMNVICLYKIGLILTPGEVKSWTKGIRKLTSSRHKNILLRIVHGDIFSNERLHRFGLVDSPTCKNCQELIEDRHHRILRCPKAEQA